MTANLFRSWRCESRLHDRNRPKPVKPTVSATTSCRRRYERRRPWKDSAAVLRFRRTDCRMLYFVPPTWSVFHSCALRRPPIDPLLHSAQPMFINDSVWPIAIFSTQFRAQVQLLCSIAAFHMELSCLTFFIKRQDSESSTRPGSVAPPPGRGKIRRRTASPHTHTLHSGN